MTIGFPTLFFCVYGFIQILLRCKTLPYIQID
jgi:hypothetical protein